MNLPSTRAEALRLDAADPLAPFRERFRLPPGVIYLDGNSLGALPRSTPGRLLEVAEKEWGEGLIRSWNQAGWIDLAPRVAGKIARLLGARPGEVMVADSTSINLWKLLAAALEIQGPGRRVIVSSTGNFPGDLYMMEGLLRLAGPGHALRLTEDPASALDTDVAVLALTHVDYRTGSLWEIAELTARAHEAGALALWDLAHTAGVLPLDLTAAGVDLAVGCGYKYLNGGPGAPAFLYVAESLQERAASPLQGWLGHARPFAFESSYEPAPGIGRFACGTPPILSLAALEEGVDLALAAPISAVRAKSMALGDLFLARAAERCAGMGLTPACPRDARNRGSQVALAHPHGYALMQALIARGVIGDFRAPDLLRFGFAPLYVGHADVWDAVEILGEVLTTGAWDRPEFHRRAAVT